MKSVKNFLQNPIYKKYPQYLPTFILNCKSEEIIKEIIVYISDYIFQNKFFEDRCSRKWARVEYDVNVIDPIKKFKSELTKMAHENFRNEYTGVVWVDISCWINKISSVEFVKLMKFINANRNHMVFVLTFSIPYDNESLIWDELEKYVQTYYLDVDSSHDTAGKLVSKLNEVGIIVSKDAVGVLKKYLKANEVEGSNLRNFNERFIGCCIQYTILNESRELTKANVNDIISRTNKIIKQTEVKIGFVR